MVAKSYQGLKQIGEPFTESGRKYIYVEKNGSQKKVRWYTDTEYQKMYPDSEPTMKKLAPLKHTLGFDDGYIMLVKGEDGFFTGTYNTWLREDTEATYRSCWGWGFESGSKIPEQLPAGLGLVKLTWEQVADVEKDELKPKEELKRIIDSLIYDATVSEFQGEVGERLEIAITVKKVIDLEGYYGTSHFHIFTDYDGNEYVWNTASKKLEESKEYDIRGTVKEHKVYRNSKQTVLTRCKIM